MESKEQFERALGLLGSRLEIEGAPSTILFVCGGSALLIMGFIQRPTKDVDVVAIGHAAPEGGLIIKSGKPFPDYLAKAARQVARDLGLDENWLNSGPADLMKFGLPEGYNERTIKHLFGQVLSIHFLGRFDLIHLKLYAAVDHGPGKHIEDLLALKPANAEILSAARWAMQHDPSEPFRMTLKDMLKKIGYEEISERI
jgi:hypothetical protein